MINKQRVRRIKNIFYMLLLLAFILPVILSVVIFFKVLHLEIAIGEFLGQNPAVLAVQAAGMAPTIDEQSSVQEQIADSSDSFSHEAYSKPDNSDLPTDALEGEADEVPPDAPDLLQSQSTPPSDTVDLPDTGARAQL